MYPQPKIRCQSQSRWQYYSVDFLLVLSNRYATCPAAVAGLTFDVLEWCVRRSVSRVSWAKVSQVLWDDWSWCLRVSQCSSSIHALSACLREDSDEMPGCLAISVMDSLVVVQRTRSLCLVDVIRRCLRCTSTVEMMCRGEPTRESGSARVMRCHVPVVFSYTLRSISFHFFQCGSR